MKQFVDRKCLRFALEMPGTHQVHPALKEEEEEPPLEGSHECRDELIHLVGTDEQSAPKDE